MATTTAVRRHRTTDVTDITEQLKTEKTKRTSVELSEYVFDRLEEIAGSTFKTSATKKRYTRDEVMEHFLRWALEEWDSKRAEGEKRLRR